MVAFCDPPAKLCGQSLAIWPTIGEIRLDWLKMAVLPNWGSQKIALLFQIQAGIQNLRRLRILKSYSFSEL